MCISVIQFDKLVHHHTSVFSSLGNLHRKRSLDAFNAFHGFSIGKILKLEKTNPIHPKWNLQSTLRIVGSQSWCLEIPEPSYTGSNPSIGGSMILRVTYIWIFQIR